MRNQYMAKVLVHNKMVTEDQVNAYWGEITDSQDIGQVLVKAGLLQQGVYEKVLAFVKNLEEKNAAAARAPEPAAQPAAQEAPKVNRSTTSIPAIKPVGIPTPASPAPVKTEPKDEEPTLQIEGNNIFGEATSSNMDVEKVSGLETTSISSIGIKTDEPEDESAEEGELPSRFALATGEGKAVEAPEVLTTKMNLRKIIAYARKFGTTDIYLFANRQIIMRQSGNLFAVTEDALDTTRLTDLLGEASEGFADAYKVSVGKNFSKTMGLAGVGRARITVTWDDVVPNISIRVIPTESTTLENLYLPAFCGRFADLQSGLVLIAGPASSGRSTTMTTFAETVAANRQCYIQTVERPIERLLQNPNGAIVQKEVGLHVRTGVAGIELAIRDGVDVICFDHLTSMNELNLLLQAANAGALVFAVTGGNNIHALLSRLLASVPEVGRPAFACALADQLKGIIVQHLVPVVQNQGLVLACEAMRISSTVANMIRKCDLSQVAAAISSQKDQGVTLDDSLQKCLESGYIEGTEAWKRAYDSRRFAAYRPAGKEA